ncbi:MAG: TIGR04086 family membrane protein [Lachnospiraceae bacterium]
MELFSPKKLLQALLCSYLLSAVLLLATAFFLYRFRLKESQIRLAVAVIYVLSGALAGFFSSPAPPENVVSSADLLPDFLTF